MLKIRIKNTEAEQDQEQKVEHKLEKLDITGEAIKKYLADPNGKEKLDLGTNTTR